MYRKILVNLLAAFLAPFVLLFGSFRDLFNAVFYQRYKYHDFQIDSLKEYLYVVYGQMYIPFFVLSLILFFIPFQLIKDYYGKEKKYEMLTFFRKWILLTSIILCWIIFWGFFTNIWGFPLYKNLIYIPFAAIISLVFTTFFHYMLDRHKARET